MNKEPRKVTTISLTAKELLMLNEIQNRRLQAGETLRRVTQSEIFIEGLGLLYAKEMEKANQGPEVPTLEGLKVMKGFHKDLPLEERILRMKLANLLQTKGTPQEEIDQALGELNKMLGVG